MIPLKESIASRKYSIAQLQMLQLNKNHWWSNIKTLYYTGRFGQASSEFEEKFKNLIKKPVAAAIELLTLPLSGKYEILYIISDILYQCKHYKAALQLYHYMTDRGISDEGYRIAHYRLCEYINLLLTYCKPH